MSKFITITTSNQRTSSCSIYICMTYSNWYTFRHTGAIITEGVQANLSILPEDGTSVPKHVTVYVWRVLHHEVHLLDHNILTTTYGHAQSELHKMPTATDVAKSATRAHWKAYFQNLERAPRTARQFLTLCSLYCTPPRAEGWLRNWEEWKPTLEIHRSVQTVYNDLSLKCITRSHVFGSIIVTLLGIISVCCDMSHNYGSSFWLSRVIETCRSLLIVTYYWQ